MDGNLLNSKLNYCIKCCHFIFIVINNLKTPDNRKQKYILSNKCIACI